VKEGDRMGAGTSRGTDCGGQRLFNFYDASEGPVAPEILVRPTNLCC